MSETTSPQTWGGLSGAELGALIGGVGAAILVVIVCITVIVAYKYRSKEKKSKEHKDDDEKMVNMQTSRIVNGQPMQQVIVRSQHGQNGNRTDSRNQNDIPYQTMDHETNTVRYDTANQSSRQEPPSAVPGDEEASKVEDADADVDSGTGDSPIRTAVVIHSENEDRNSHSPSKRSSNSGASHNDSAGSIDNSPVGADNSADDITKSAVGIDNAAYASDEETDVPSPYATTYYSMPPPPPVTEPPPPTPGIPVTDLDEGETIIVPPPPPPPSNDIYAEINKSRNSKPPEASTSREDSIKRSMYSYRDTAEIQIIEKEKF